MELEVFLTLGGIGRAFWILALIMFSITAKRSNAFLMKELLTPFASSSFFTCLFHSP